MMPRRRWRRWVWGTSKFMYANTIVPYIRKNTQIKMFVQFVVQVDGWIIIYSKGKKIPHKVLRYFPLAPRLKHLYVVDILLKRWDGITLIDQMRKVCCVILLMRKCGNILILTFLLLQMSQGMSGWDCWPMALMFLAIWVCLTVCGQWSWLHIIHALAMFERFIFHVDNINSRSLSSCKDMDVFLQSLIN